MGIQAHFLQDKNQEKFYPYGHADAVFDRNGKKVGTRLDELESSVSNIEGNQVQSDWNTTDAEDISFIKNKPVNATQEVGGFMSATDKIKLDGVASGANKTVVDSSLNSTSTNPVQNKVINSALSGKVPMTRTINGKALSSNISLSASDVGAIPTSQKGAASGVAELDSTGKVPSTQLPSYVDDVLEFNNRAAFPETGETGKIYIAKDTNKTYRWSGSTYVEIASGLALGETSSTAYRGDYGKIAYEHSLKAHAPSNAEANVQSDWSVSDTSSDAYIKNKPTSMPANGGNADTVNNHSVQSDVPANAVFTDTKPVAMKGATSSAAGSAGYVPAPSAGAQAKYLRGDGTWQEPPSASLPALGVTATATELNYMDGVTSNVQTQLNGKANLSHTHNYAGSSSAGGAANSVKSSLIIKLNGGTTEGTNMVTFNGETAKTINVTPSAIGAAATSHGTHVSYGSDNPKANGTASAGTATTVSRSDHVHPLQTTVSGNAGSATKLATARTIDGVSFNGSANIIHYGTCSTAAATAAKTVGLTGFTLVTGAIITVRFSATNSAANPTLNVNGTGAKAIRYRNAAITAGYLAANRTYTFVYDGIYYQLVGDINVDTNTTYNTGTATTAGLTKLYTGTGTNTDGTMTQDAITDALAGKASSSHNHSATNITSGTLGVARGGTGVTANPSMLVNLSSTTATGVFTASPRPGITGTLSVSHGGTGGTTVASARTNIGAINIIVDTAEPDSQNTGDFWFKEC